jgi:hypothetical protein
VGGGRPLLVAPAEHGAQHEPVASSGGRSGVSPE